jgi:hypothetical protein
MGENDLPCTETLIDVTFGLRKEQLRCFVQVTANPTSDGFLQRGFI